MPPPSTQALPARVDVLVIGAGYTGLAAARETAAAGRSTLVLDAGALGAGCSSRNGGQVAYSIKPSFEELRAKFGADVALRDLPRGTRCRERTCAPWPRKRSIAIGARTGCFFGAHTARHFSRMVRDAENQPRGLEQRIDMRSQGGTAR